LLADYVTVVEDRPIISVKYCLPVPVFHFRPKLMYPAARSLCDSWASCHYSTEPPLAFGIAQNRYQEHKKYELCMPVKNFRGRPWLRASTVGYIQWQKYRASEVLYSLDP